MTPRPNKKVYLLVGTHKGAFMFVSDLNRKNWEMKGPFLKGGDVNHLVLDQRDGSTLFAAANSYWWGPTIKMSRNFGKTWTDSKSGVRFEKGSDLSVARVWCVFPGRESEPDVLYAGVDPGSLFKSEDAGKSWYDVKALTKHPTRKKWNPGAGGLTLHSMCLHPNDKKKMFIGISAAGTFYTEDGGKSWTPRNKGVLADFLPEKYPQVGQCVHHMEFHPSRPDVLYQQNHCGVYRSDDGGKNWIDISKGLPSRFGFPLKVLPNDPDTIYVIPEDSPEFRCPVDGKFAVYRSRNRGKSWKRLDKGLPSRNAYLNIYRQAMAVDACDPAGVYVGTSTGDILYSRNEGDSWQVLTHWLAPVYSLECAVI